MPNDECASKQPEQVNGADREKEEKPKLWQPTDTEIHFSFSVTSPARTPLASPLRLWSMGLCLLIYELVCCSWSNTPNSKGKKESRLSHTHTLRDRQRAATQKRGRDYKRKINKNKSNSSNMLLTDSPY